MSEHSEARKKVREAEFFLTNLRSSESDSRLDKEDFDFYLSAFLSAGRSVTFVMQAEQKDEYDRWFPGWVAALSQADRSLMNFMRDNRNTTQKVGSSAREREVEYEDWVAHQARRNPGRAPRLTFVSSQRSARAQIGVARHYFRLDGALVPAVELCAQYLQLLHTLLDAFALAYPPDSPATG